VSVYLFQGIVDQSSFAAETDDYVYGQSGAKNQAITDPGKAIDNVDNHEYFAENAPTLP
jgi:peptidyl-Lys metalloendopeptidase